MPPNLSLKADVAPCYIGFLLCSAPSSNAELQVRVPFERAWEDYLFSSTLSLDPVRSGTTTSAEENKNAAVLAAAF